MQNSLLTGRPFLSILRFSLPLFLGSAASQALSFLDSLILSRLAGVSAFAAASASGAALMPVMGLAMGVAAGSVIPVTIACGKGDRHGIRSHAAGAAALTALASVCLAILAECLLAPLLNLTGTPRDILCDAVMFSRIALLSCPAAALSALFSGLLRASGSARAAVKYQLIGACLNLPLDALFLSLGMGISGAALGGLAAQVFAAVLAGRAVLRHPLFSDMERAGKREIREAFSSAVPLCLQFSVGALSGMACQSMVNSHGSMAVAAVAAAERTLGIFAMPARVTGGAVEVFSGHNLGAGQLPRVRQGVWETGSILFCFGAAMCVPIFLFGNEIARVFVPAPSPVLMPYLLIGALFLPFEFIANTVRNALQGIGRPGLAALAGAIDAVTRTGIALFAGKSLTALLLLQPVGTAVSLAALLLLYFSVIREGSHAKADARPEAA